MLPKALVALPIKASVIDGLIAVVVMVVPMFVVSIADGSPHAMQLLSLAALVLGFSGILFRDAIGKGTSVGKRYYNLQVVDLRTREPCGRRRVWARNLLDVIPLLNAIDFICICVDAQGQKILDKALELQLIDRREVLLAGESRVAAEADK